MDGEFENKNSAKQIFHIENDDAKYVSGLSTVLVATIQEAKDRISQIEYIFCSQLYPIFQSKSKSLQKIHSEARISAEETWKKKEKELLLQIEILQREKKEAIVENQSLKNGRSKASKEREENVDQLQLRLKGEQQKVEELGRRLMQKSRESDEGMSLQHNLLQMIHSKTCEIVSKEQQLKEHEEITKLLRTKLSDLEEKIEELQKELKQEMEKVAMGKQWEEALMKRIDSQESKIMDYEQIMKNQDNEKELLTVKLKDLEENVRILHLDLRKKTEEIEEGNNLHRQLLQRINSNASEILDNEEKLKEYEKERKLLVATVDELQNKVNGLQLNLTGKNDEITEGRDSLEGLHQQIESQTLQLLDERKKRLDLIDRYKRLKSQYSYFCKKHGYTEEGLISWTKVEDKTDPMSLDQNRTSPEDKSPHDSMVVSEAKEVKKEIDDDNNWKDKNEVNVNEARVPDTLVKRPSAPTGPKCNFSTKTEPLSTRKRPASSWRDTRSNQGQVRFDPHDDFLDTPLENIRENLNKGVKERVHDLPVTAPKDMNLNSSDDETQDVGAYPKPQQQHKPVPESENKGFKFVEPVRKKADRENLKGVECKQCKKFYDAVLPTDGNAETTGDTRSFRCEHHDGVSRHRYRYVPPLTPEGFWNIGFESEM